MKYRILTPLLLLLGLGILFFMTHDTASTNQPTQTTQTTSEGIHF